jgi:hypothetical protein
MTTPPTALPETLSNGLPPPPIPQRLRDRLNDYPTHLMRLQEALNYALDGPKPARGTTSAVFEEIIWALEGRLETFIREAKDELETAQASSDTQAIALADDKLRLMFRARSSNGGMKGLHELWSYLELHQEALR